MVYNFLYKTTNLINNKFYIGIHQTDNLDDGYLGSGKLILQAIKKYGRINFNREILNFFETYSEAAVEERRIVSEEFILDTSNYNICLGGGFPPRKSGKDHAQYGSKKPEQSRRMMENNPMSNPVNIAKIKNRITVKDLNGNIFSVFKDDPRYINGEVVHINKGKVTVRDVDGNVFHCEKDDPRYISGELVPASKGVTKNISPENKEKIYSKVRGRKQSREEIERRRASQNTEDCIRKKREAMLGKIHSNETKIKMSEAQKGISKEQVACPYCGKIGGISAMKRWHFDNCREQ